MAFLFKSKKNQDRALHSREGPPGSQTSLQGASARVARNEKGSLERSTPTGSVNSVDNDGSMGSPDHGFGRQRGQSVDQQQQSSQSQPPLQQQPAQQSTGDLPVSSDFPLGQLRRRMFVMDAVELTLAYLVASKRTRGSIAALEPQCRPVSLVATKVNVHVVASEPFPAVWRRRQFRLV